MKRVIWLFVFFVIFVSLCLAQSQITPELQIQLNGIGVIANILSGIVITLIIKALKGKFAFITDAITVVVSCIFSLAFLYMFDWLLGWGVWKDANFFLNVVTALGLNQTVSSFVYELFKKKVPAIK
jgi:hypothetical protein